jgi:hypothetical protein
MFKILEIYILTKLSIIFPFSLYGCRTLSLTAREEHGLRPFKNGVLRKLLGHKQEEVTSGWRKLHNEEIINL